MDYLTQKHLLSAAAQVDAAMVCLTTAGVKAAKVTAPSFHDRIETLRSMAENLASDIYEAAGPSEKHGAIAAEARGEVTCIDPHCPVHGRLRDMEEDHPGEFGDAPECTKKRANAR